MDNSGAERNEWPTEQRLQSLRAQGVVAVSWSSIYFATVLGLLVGIALVLPRMHDLYQSWNEAIMLERGYMLPAVRELFLIVAAPALSAFVFGLLVGLLQSRFLFRLRAVGFNFGALAAPVWWSGVKGRALSDSFGAAIWLALGLALAVVVGLAAYREFLTLFNHEWRWIPLRLNSLGIPLFWGISVVAFCSVIAAWLIGRFRFMLKHRMSRKELERETEELHIT